MIVYTDGESLASYLTQFSPDLPKHIDVLPQQDTIDNCLNVQTVKSTV